MKILHIDETFHPLYGYHTSPLAKAEAKSGNEVYIITGTWDKLYPVYKNFNDNVKNGKEVDAAYEKKYGIKIVRVKIKKYISSRAIYDNEVFKAIDEIKPDLIYVHLVESVISMKMLTKKKRYPMIFDSHMLTMASNNKFSKLYSLFYRNIITPIIKKNKYFVVRTQDDPYVNKVLNIPSYLTPHISFATDTDLFKPCAEQKADFIKEHNLPENSFVFVYTGKLTPGKGGMLLAQAIKEKIVSENKTAVFLIVGNSVGEYGEQVEDTFKESENIVIRYPVQKYIDLPQIYQSADVCLFPKQCSLSFYDAQGCGLPVISEDNNVNADRCSHKNGWVFSSGSVEDFRCKLQDTIDMDDNCFNEYRKNAIAYIMGEYNYDAISKQYSELYTRVISDFNQNKR